jgi:hypothetical protein
MKRSWDDVMGLLGVVTMALATLIVSVGVCFVMWKEAKTIGGGEDAWLHVLQEGCTPTKVVPTDYGLKPVECRGSDGLLYRGP